MPLAYGFFTGLLGSSVPVEIVDLACPAGVWFVVQSTDDRIEEEKSNMSALNNPVIAVIISTIIAVGYFTLVDHYLMDMQGLDYWYLFRK